MSGDRRRRVKQLFGEALDLPQDEREAFVRRTCAADEALETELRSLLDAHHRSEDFLGEGHLAGAVEAFSAEQADSLEGTTIGHYTLVGLLGRGGMGAVYRAEQENPRREVALKLVDRMIVTPGLLRRFEVETQVLGRLKHPGIAQIYEAGTHQSELGERPYFAMELVEGSPITSYADERGLDRRARLETLIRVCEAVQHAHRVGVIHRDLKPANVFVTKEGQPKILDFGVARSADRELQVTTMLGGEGGLIGTLPYMSPEQVRGNPEELDTRSDVYALGVLCFELLTGRYPRDLSGKTITDAIRVITDEEPGTLRAVAGRSFPADLETVVATALASDKERRYGSASDLAADLRRFLDGQPIAARPQGTLYQLRKLVLRNRVPAALIAGLIAISLGSAIVMTLQARRTAEERDRANLEAETAKEVSAFLQSLFSSADPGRALGETLTAREILERGASRIETELADQPLVRARLLVVMGRVYDQLGLPDRGEPLLVEAVELGREARARDPREAMRAELHEALVFLARQRATQGRNEEAIALCREALALALQVGGEDSLYYATCANSLAYQLALVGEYEESRSLIERGLELRERHLGPVHSDVAWSHYQYAWLFRSLGQHRRAIEHFDRAREIWERTLPENHPQLATCLFGSSFALLDAGDLDGSLDHLIRALEIQRSSLGDDHVAVGDTLNNIGHIHWRKGDLEGAFRSIEESVATYRLALGQGSDKVLRGLAVLASLAQDMGRHAQARDLLQDRLELALAHHDHDSEAVREARRALDELGPSE